MIEKILERLEAKAVVNPIGGKIVKYVCINDIIDVVREVEKECGDASDNDLAVVSALPSLYPLQPFEEEAIHKVVASAKDGGWIPCSERLPSESERWIGHDITDAEPREFIVMVKGAYEPTTGYYTNNGWVKDIYDKEESGYADEIIAWRFFPAPYQKGE